MISTRLSLWLFLTLALLSQVSFSVAQPADNYKITANDLLDFRVFEEPELDAVVRVNGDGQAIFPLIGSVTIGGTSIADATEVIKRSYRDGYLINPQVTLTIRSYAKRLFTVLGEVQKPGSYEMQGTDEITLLQAIGMAGGYTKIANPGSITVKRREDTGEQVIKLNAKRMARGDDKASFLVRPGDVISVGESLF
jgi:protein involved in polysaccharide export with SLBB domain